METKVIKCHICGKKQELYFRDILNGILESACVCHNYWIWLKTAYELLNDTGKHNVLVDADYNIYWPKEYDGGISNWDKGFC